MNAAVPHLLETRCQTCGTLAAETVCHLCKEPRHQPSCPGCERCITSTNKPDREYRNVRDLDQVGRPLPWGRG